MLYNVNIQSNSAAELATVFNAIAAVTGNIAADTKPVQPQAHIHVQTAHAAAPVEGAKAPAPVEATTPKKPKPTPAKTAETAPGEAQPPAVTLDDVRKKLSEFSAKFDVPQTKAFLKDEFGLLKISELPKEKYIECIGKLDERITAPDEDPLA